MLLTKEEIILILNLIAAERYCHWYGVNPTQARKLQAKLSIILEAKQRKEEWETMFPDPAELLIPFLKEEEK